MKYGLVTKNHAGFKVGDILELVTQNKQDGGWQCNFLKYEHFSEGGKAWCSDNCIRIISKEKDPEEFL